MKADSHILYSMMQRTGDKGMTSMEIISFIALLELEATNFDIEYFGYNNNGHIVSMITNRGVVIGDHMAEKVSVWCHESLAC